VILLCDKKRFFSIANVEIRHFLSHPPARLATTPNGVETRSRRISTVNRFAAFLLIGSGATGEREREGRRRWKAEQKSQEGKKLQRKVRQKPILRSVHKLV
jgi:hypothetical protein